MVALAAATSAIDGLYSVIQPIVTPPAELVTAAQAAKAAGRRPPNRRAWVIETLKAGYRPSAAGALDRTADEMETRSVRVDR